MIILTNPGTADKLQLVTAAAATVDVLVSWVDLNANGSGDPTPGRTPTAITTATTTDIVAGPASAVVRNVKEISVRNKHATTSSDVTVMLDVNGTDYEINKSTLAAGEALEYIEGVGWFKIGNASLAAPNNYSVTAQVLTAATLTQIAGSTITVPSGKLRIGTMLQWSFDITKTAAGTASSAFHVRVGTANSVADTAVLTFTKIAGTAAVDTGIITITANVRGPLSASCIMAGNFGLIKNAGTIVGHSTLPTAALSVVSSGFDATVANLFVSLSATTGASDAVTIQAVQSESVNL